MRPGSSTAGEPRPPMAESQLFRGIFSESGMVGRGIYQLTGSSKLDWDGGMGIQKLQKELDRLRSENEELRRQLRSSETDDLPQKVKQLEQKVK